MASYVVLARKWRPAQFSDIVGQGPVVRTLMNAIRAERIHHAYLMTGSRGIGKTSIARIFAKVVRCQSTRLEGEALRSCDECASCREITAGNSVDVIEIDGASNNGVDAIREIRENAKFLPSSGTKKIYIVDEVHMLTTAAFNALLKTLEEPPAHVIFIFATTEPHKIPGTILSRLQRFDLRRVTSAQIQDRLSFVLQAEGVHADPGAVAMISRAADGGMRDALSLLDQVLSYAGTSLTVAAVRESIGLIESQTLLGLFRAVIKRQPLEAIGLVEKAYLAGHDLRVLTRSLIELVHASILAKVGSLRADSLELSSEEWDELKSLSSDRELEELEMIFQALHHGLEWVARSPQPKIVLDVLLIKCASAEALIYADAGAAGSGGGGKPIAAQADATPRPAAPVTRASTAPVSIPVEMPARPTSTGVDPLMAFVGQIAAPIAPKTIAAPPTETPIEPTRKPVGSVTWEGFVAHTRANRPLLASIFENGNPERLPGGEGPDSDLLALCFNPPDAYYREQLQTRAYAEQFQSLAREYFGRHIKLRVEIKDSGESLAARKERERNEQEKNVRAAAQNHPIIAEARSLFGGELGPIELVEGATHATP